MTDIAKSYFTKTKDEVAGFQIYNQYQDVIWAVGLFKLFKTLCYSNTYDGINLLNNLSFMYENSNDFIQYYYLNLFGFKRQLGDPKINILYDSDYDYDSGNKYDDSTFDGFLDLSYFKVACKYFFNYDGNTYNLVWLYKFVAEFCNMDYSEFSIECDYDKVIVNIPTTEQSVLMNRIFLNQEDYLNIPITDITFNLTEAK